MIAMPVDQHTSFYPLGPTLNNDGILPGSHGTARATQFGAQVVDAVGLFVVQALDIVEDAFPYKESDRIDDLTLCSAGSRCCIRRFFLQQYKVRQPVRGYSQ